MATRHQAREAVTTVLYAIDVGNEGIDKYIDELLEDRKIRNKQKEFALSLYKGVTEHLEEIDEVIKKNLVDWDFEKVGKIERAILRLGVYELLFTDTDKAVVIDEALESVKRLSEERAAKFINAVLDKIAKEYKK